MQSSISQLTLFPDTIPDVENALVKTELILGELHGSEPSADLVGSVENLGILLPIIVERKSGGLWIVDGRRRLKAAKVVGLEEIPVRIIPEGAVKHTETITIQANTARRANPVSEYHAIRSLTDKGFTVPQIARELGIKSGIVDKRLQLATLDPVLFELMETGRIAVGVGEAAAKLSPEQQEKLVKVFSETDKITAKDVSAVKKASVAEASEALEDVLFGDEDKKRADAKVAIRHLDAVAEILVKHGIKVDLSALRSGVETLSR